MREEGERVGFLESFVWLVEKKKSSEEFLRPYLHQNLCFVNDFALTRQLKQRYYFLYCSEEYCYLNEYILSFQWYKDMVDRGRHSLVRHYGYSIFKSQKKIQTGLKTKLVNKISVVVQQQRTKNN